MFEMLDSVRLAQRRLARRLAIGLFLDVWPLWTSAALLVAGGAALTCRLFFPAAAPVLPWLWLVPLVMAGPALVQSVTRAYRPSQVVALADWLGGGRGLLLALDETNDPVWSQSVAVADASFELPRVRPWRRLSALLPAAAFFATAMLLPQRAPARPAESALAELIVADLTAALLELKHQQLVTPEEEQSLEQEIERIRQAAGERVDAASWEAADALREKVASEISDRRDALKWAEASLSRMAAARSGETLEPAAEAYAAELAQALERLAESGLLAGAPPALQRLAGGGKLPIDPEALATLTADLSKYLTETSARLSDLGKLAGGAGRFDPAEFPLESDTFASDRGAKPGRGGVTRGRGDGPLTWGTESQPLDRFKALALPPGAPRSPDDWAPLAVLPGDPRQASPQRSASGAARTYAATAGQTAWRRTLTPRHQSAVKKYFAK